VTEPECAYISSTPRDHLDAGDEHLLDVLGDIEAMGLWELVRAQRSPIMLTELAELSGMPTGRVQALLDGLVGAGLIRAVRARKPRNSIGYASNHDRLVVTFDPSDPATVARVREISRAWERHTDDLITNHGDHASDPCATYRARYFGVDHLDRSDFEELKRRIDRVCEFWNMLAAKNVHSHPSGRRVRQGNHVISLRVEPLAHATLPNAEVWFRPRGQQVPDAASVAMAKPRKPLTTREEEVARALAGGMQRQRVATQLGVSIHTLTTMCKRIYVKLGVHSQAELAAVMRAAPGLARTAE
jgi:DNA-binding NarL/FixJ family response regulator